MRPGGASAAHRQDSERDTAEDEAAEDEATESARHERMRGMQLNQHGGTEELRPGTWVEYLTDSDEFKTGMVWEDVTPTGRKKPKAWNNWTRWVRANRTTHVVACAANLVVRAQEIKLSRESGGGTDFIRTNDKVRENGKGATVCEYPSLVCTSA